MSKNNENLQKMYEYQQLYKGNEAEYVVRGAEVYCSNGTKPCILQLPEDHGVYAVGQPLIAESDVTKEHIEGFGKCKLIDGGNGLCDPKLCNWHVDHCNVQIYNLRTGTNESAVTDSAVAVCRCGGIVRFKSSGQINPIMLPANLKRMLRLSESSQNDTFELAMDLSSMFYSIIRTFDPYEILDFNKAKAEYKRINEEWDIAEAEKPPVNATNAPDYTDAINQALEKNIDKFAMYKCSRALVEDYKAKYTFFEYPERYANAWTADNILLIASMKEFYEQMKTGGPMDIKVEEMWEDMFGNSAPFTRDPFIFEGEAITADELGNINYGYVGTALGYSEEVLLAGGGFAHSKAIARSSGNNERYFIVIGLSQENFGERPEDVIRIKQGIELYKERNKTKK